MVLLKFERPAVHLAVLLIQCLLLTSSIVDLARAERGNLYDGNSPAPSYTLAHSCDKLLINQPRLTECCDEYNNRPDCGAIKKSCCLRWYPDTGGVHLEEDLMRNEETDEIDKIISCVRKFYLLASQPEKARTVRIPWECCKHEPFILGCKRLGARMDRLVRMQMLAAAIRTPRHSESIYGLTEILRSPTCSRRQVRTCCGDGQDDPFVSSINALSKRDRGLLSCTLELFMNVISFKLEVPRACCSVLIFKLFAKCRQPEPDPVPWPSPPPARPPPPPPPPPPTYIPDPPTPPAPEPVTTDDTPTLYK